MPLLCPLATVVPVGQIKRRNSGLPKMESVARLSSIPVVETGLKNAEHAYFRLKVRIRTDLFTPFPFLPAAYATATRSQDFPNISPYKFSEQHVAVSGGAREMGGTPRVNALLRLQTVDICRRATHYLLGVWTRWRRHLVTRYGRDLNFLRARLVDWIRWCATVWT